MLIIPVRSTSARCVTKAVAVMGYWHPEVADKAEASNRLKLPDETSQVMSVKEKAIGMVRCVLERRT